MIICVTGHRPDKLYGYDLTDSRWQNLKNIFKEKLIEMKCTNAISGMALGVDTIFALAVLELKKEGHPIQLHCALPCPEQCKKWNHVSAWVSLITYPCICPDKTGRTFFFICIV